MPGKTRLCLWFLILLAVALPGCQQIINYPAPTISALSPTSVTAGNPIFTLKVTGYNFTPASSISWNGAALATMFTNINTLTAQVAASLIQNAGTANIVVTTPAPGGGTTQTLTFVINPTPSPTPKISSTSPLSILAGSGSFTLTIIGSNFVEPSVVDLGNVPLQTTFVNPTLLQTIIPGNSVSNGGTLQLTVVNPASPAPGGGSSNVYSFSVNNPVPGITTLSPTTMAAGGAASNITITGTGFVPSSVVLINGAPRTTTSAGPTQATVTLNTADLAAGGIDQLQVANPAPGGGTSNAATFAVDPTIAAGLPVQVDYGLQGSQANDGICGGLSNCQSGALGLILTTAGPATSEKGEFVAFASVSSNLVANQTNSASQIFIRDTCLSVTCTPATFVVSVAADGGPSNGPSSEPSLDSGAAHAAYTSQASNIVSYVGVTSGVKQVYWQPVCATGSTSTTSTVPLCSSAKSNTGGVGGGVLVSLGADGSPGNGDSYNPVISPDGEFVTFVSLATNLVSGVTVDGVTPQVYLRTICNGETPLNQTTTSTTATTTCPPVTYLVSSPDGKTPGNAASSRPVIANGGVYVSFVSLASNLGFANPNDTQQIFEQHECQIATLGCVPTMALMSTPDGATPAGGVNLEPSISYDGRFVAFASTANNLGAAANGTQQIYVRDTCLEVTTTCSASTKLVSTPDGTTPANGLSESPSLNLSSTASGQYIAFASLASNLSSNAANGVENIYVRDTCDTVATATTACAPVTALASQAAGSSPPASNGNSYSPSLSDDGHTVSFISFASDLVANDTNGLEDIFLAATSF